MKKFPNLIQFSYPQDLSKNTNKKMPLPPDSIAHVWSHIFNSNIDQESPTAHNAAENILNSYYDLSDSQIKIEKEMSGKPYLSSGKSIKIQMPAFNLSHSNNLICFVISARKSLGVDIEYLDNKIDYKVIAKRCFSKKELEYISSKKKLAYCRFLEIWTLKEACIKAKGLSLENLSDLFVLNPASNEVIKKVHSADGNIYEGQLFYAKEKYIGAVVFT